MQCGNSFPIVTVIDGRRRDLRGRKRCLTCRPLRALKAPRKPVIRPISWKTCEACGEPFPARLVIDGKAPVPVWTALLSFVLAVWYPQHLEDTAWHAARS